MIQQRILALKIQPQFNPSKKIWPSAWSRTALTDSIRMKSRRKINVFSTPKHSKHRFGSNKEL